MNKRLRGGVNLRVALVNGVAPATQETPDAPSMPAANPAVVDRPRRSPIKSMLKPVARVGYRLVKPIVRPVVFRLRRYLIDDLRGQLQAEVHASTNHLSEQALVNSESLARHVEAQSRLAADAAARVVVEHVNRQLANQTLELSESLFREAAAHFEAAGEASLVKFEEHLHRITGQLAADFKDQLIAATDLALSESKQMADRIEARLERTESYAGAAARRVSLMTDVGQVLIRTEVGYVACASNDLALVAALLEAGELETGTRTVIQRHLRPGDVFVDVGANIGMHTIAAARAVGPTGRVIAFEPFAETARMLQASLWLNGLSGIVDVHVAAVSSSDGTHALHLGRTSGHHSLYDLDPSDNAALSQVDVPLVRLDGILGPEERIDLIKIDVEGAELDVLVGGMRALANRENVALIVEFGPEHIGRTGHTVDGWFDAFEDAGFEWRAIQEQSGTLERRSRSELTGVTSVNLFMARPGSPAWELHK